MLHIILWPLVCGLFAIILLPTSIGFYALVIFKIASLFIAYLFPTIYFKFAVCKRFVKFLDKKDDALLKEEGGVHKWVLVVSVIFNAIILAFILMSLAS